MSSRTPSTRRRTKRPGTVRYGVIYADPPWRFASEYHHNGTGCRMQPRYPMQSTDWIASLPVGRIAAPDSMLFLWTTSAHLPEALRVMQRWGFEFKTVAFVWHKKSWTGKEQGTAPVYTIGTTEQVLLGTRGKAHSTLLKRRDVRQFVEAPRVGHSVKPEEVARRIEMLVGPDVPKIELFARKRLPGWDVWGNEVQSDLNLLAV